MEINVVQICRKLICLQRYGVDLGNNCFRNLLISKNSLYLLTLHNSVTILNVKEVKKKMNSCMLSFFKHDLTYQT